MWDTSEEPPGTMEGGPPETTAQDKETYEQTKNQLESLKEIMMRSKQTLKKKEEEVQEYARRLSKIKSRTKISRRSKEADTSSKDVPSSPKIGETLGDSMEDVIDDIAQAKTVKAKSSLLQRKLAENRKAFEQRSKEMTETKRAVEEKVEAMRQQLDETSLTMDLGKDSSAIGPVRPIMVMSEVMTPMMQLASSEEKDIKIEELNKRILELEATVVDLTENLKEKDSVIESKTQAVTLMSADLSKKGKTTLDTLEDTKDEMRTMQEHFVLLETSLKNKNENLLEQLRERNDRISELDETVQKLEDQLKEQQLAESTNANLTRSTMDTLADTKDAMKSMQENFVLIESSLKMKNDNLFQQLQDYEVKLAEANERIFRLESGAGIVKSPDIEGLQIKLEKLERNNRQLQDEKYELQKSIAEMQDKIITSKVAHVEDTLKVKDNRIAELENLIQELKRSNESSEERSKAELETRLIELSTKNEEYLNKINELERTIQNLETEKNNIAAQISEETTTDEKVLKLTKELDELNKTMIKMKAQHRSKTKNLQKQIESFKTVSDTNAELVRLGNQVALLEEEKAAVGDWQDRIADLESKVSAQTKEIQMHVDAIATLENQKLDLMQELHSVKQEISALEAENAESENLRVTAEMKVVDLEEQLESMHKSQSESTIESSADYKELVKKIESLTQENGELYRKLTKLEEKGTSDSGSTESFETIQETDKNELLKKIEDLTQKNNELTLKLNKLEEKEDSQAGSTESFEAINDTDKNELLKKIDQLTQENSDLMTKLNRNDEKGSSDTGSTESFEKIPEQSENLSKIELLTQENNELVIKVTKLEEKIMDSMKTSLPESSDVETVVRDYHEMEMEITKLRSQVSELMEENTSLQKRIEMESQDEKLKSKFEALLEENTEIVIKLTKLEESNQDLKNDLQTITRERDESISKIKETLTDDFARERRELIDKLEKLNVEKENLTREKQELNEQINSLIQKSNEELSEKDSSRKIEDSSRQETDSEIISTLEKEIRECKQLIAEQTSVVEEMKIKLASKEEELENKTKKIMEYENSESKNEALICELKETLETLEEWKSKCNEIQEKMELLEAGKTSIEEEFRKLEKENKNLILESEQKDVATNAIKEKLESLEKQHSVLLATFKKKEETITALKKKISNKDEELCAKYTQLQNEMIAIDSLQDELNNCKVKLQRKDATIDSLRTELEKINDTMTHMTDEVDFSKNEITVLNDRLANSKSTEEYEKLLEQLRDTQMRFDKIKDKVNEYETENADLSVRLEKVSENNTQIQNQLTQKESEIVELLTTKEQLESRLDENTNIKNEMERRANDLQGILDNNAKFVDELQSELNNSYKTLEQVKLKHMEDMQMQNQRLEDMIEELNARMQENEALKAEVQDKLAGQNFTEETKHALEQQIVDLQQKLSDSENKTQTQLEKMKKIAATLQKKKAICQELEARVAELEEKWTTEKDEKEAKNKQIQEVESCLREKDNKIVDLEEKLQLAKNETVEALSKANALEAELNTAKDKINELAEHNAAMFEEIGKLCSQADQLMNDLASEKSIKGNILSEYESYKQEVTKDKEKHQILLDEVKENARELSVRMQVMEAEYMEQLALITNLKTENGMLSSKQMQISERLENAEKESEERRSLIEELQKKIVKTITATTQTTVDDFVTTESSNVQCERCEQSQALLQALESTLQEREIEIEDMDNVFARSIAGFVEIEQETCLDEKTNNSSDRFRKFERACNGLLERFNALTYSKNELFEENKKLFEKVESLQTLNSSLEERITSMERELQQNREMIEKSQNIDISYADLLKQKEEQEKELQCVQNELRLAQERANQYEQMQSYVNQSEIDKREFMEKYKELVNLKESLESKVESLIDEKNMTQHKLTSLERELETYKRKDVEPSKSVTVVSESAVPKKSNEPQLFDAFKLFGAPSVSDSDNQREIERLQHALREKEAQCNALFNEIDQLQKQIAEERLQMSQSYDQCLNNLKRSQEHSHELQTEIERLDQVLVHKNRQIDSLNVELNNVGLQLKAQFQQQNDSDENLQAVTFMKNKEIEELRLELNSTRDNFETLLEERNQHNQTLESYKNRIVDLESRLKNSADDDTIKDLENLLSTTLREKDLLQIQINDLTRELEDSKESIERQRILQSQIETVTRERDETKELVASLTQKIKDQQTILIEKSGTTGAKDLISENIPKHAQSTTQSVPTSAEAVVQQQSVNWETEDAWDPSGRLDEETWGWNAEDVQLETEQQYPTTVTIVPSAEVQLRAKIDEQQDRIKDLETEYGKLVEENKAAQIRSGKLVKKLKEYKIQIESLQQQLKVQKSSGFCELDSAIEEELKSQIADLEKSLKDVKEEHKNTVAEKEALLKKLDVLVSANERYMDMKERQDMDVEVLKLQNRELNSKMQALEWKLQEQASVAGDNAIVQISEQSLSPDTSMEPKKHQKKELSEDDPEILCKKYKDELDQLKDDMEALATENEQLQQFLEGQKNKISELESRLVSNAENSSQNLEVLAQQNSELQAKFDKSKDDYDILRKQYEQSLMDANDQVTVTRQNAEILKTEFCERNSRLETEIVELRQQAETLESRTNHLEKELQDSLNEKMILQQKVEKLSHVEEELANVSTSLTEVTDLLNIRVQEVADLKQELQKQYLDRQQSEAKLEESINLLEVELNEKKTELDNLKKAFASKENELIQQKSVETVNAVVNQATQELAYMHSVELEKKDKAIRDLNDELTTLRSTLDNYTSESQNTSRQQLIATQQEFNTRLNVLQEEIRVKESELEWYKSEVEEHRAKVNDLSNRLNETDSAMVTLREQAAHVYELQQEVEAFRGAWKEKEFLVQRLEQESQNYQIELQKSKEEIERLRAELHNAATSETRDQVESVNCLNMKIEELKRYIEDRESVIDNLNQKLSAKEFEFDKSSNQNNDPLMVDGLPLFRMGGSDSGSANNDQALQRTIDELKKTIETKQQEIEQLKYALNENTYPRIIQEMQDRINCLYDEKAYVESSLQTATQNLAEKEKQIESMKQLIDAQRQELIAKEESTFMSKERKLDQEQIISLQNELHTKEQEINELKYVIAEKDSQLSLQASMEPQSDDFELRENVQRLTEELYTKEQEIQHLKSIIDDLQNKLVYLQDLEKSLEENKNAVQRLLSEKEQVRVEAEEFLCAKLREKEAEIDEIKQRLQIENKMLHEAMQFQDDDMENLKRQLEESNFTWNQRYHQKEEELLHATSDLAEKERRLAELSITKDAELHNLKVQIHEKDVRIEELLALSEDEEKQLIEMRQSLEAREAELNTLKEQLEDKVREYELIQLALKKDVPVVDVEAARDTETEDKPSTSGELDLALYMLHQRDVRCEELTHELMQLLEERDTLQLRLSNAIRVNEELRRSSLDLSPKKEPISPTEIEEPVVEHPSPSRSQGPIEIAREAINDSIGEDKEALALKLSQLHTVSHSKDVRLRDERELRHTQQMSLLAHKDVLSTLPPEAAARLVNANYTLSRDVQSQSSVLLNWLWGKSTPKVVHM